MTKIAAITAYALLLACGTENQEFEQGESDCPAGCQTDPSETGTPDASEVPTIGPSGTSGSTDRWGSTSSSSGSSGTTGTSGSTGCSDCDTDTGTEPEGTGTGTGTGDATAGGTGSDTPGDTGSDTMTESSTDNVPIVGCTDLPGNTGCSADKVCSAGLDQCIPTDAATYQVVISYANSTMPLSLCLDDPDEPGGQGCELEWYIRGWVGNDLTHMGATLPGWSGLASLAGQLSFLTRLSTTEPFRFELWDSDSTEPTQGADDLLFSYEFDMTTHLHRGYSDRVTFDPPNAPLTSGQFTLELIYYAQ